MKIKKINFDQELEVTIKKGSFADGSGNNLYSRALLPLLQG